MGNAKGRNKGKGRGKKRSHSLNESKIATKVENKAVVKPKGEKKGKHHCPEKHVRTPRCIRLGHVVKCPIHPESYPRRLDECVKCVNADKRLVQQEQKDRKK
ncbi:hypothetical protein PITC_001050 [Penicillium italicum]|uniref:Uncharacterized protein n=1 Tax=Penicillium italicum TaxID=40296 RepID=A0A0A2L5B3_PENIT|nr:hypothetical protein PITC_001050 [Penicillium italicum]